MADDADIAQQFQEAALADALSRRASPLPFTGKCYNCRHPIPNPDRFCDVDCRDDWERRNKTPK